MENVTITILGSGTCVPSLRRSSPSVLVEITPAKILFDLGAGTIRRLLETGITISDLTHILVTHFHPDHTGELVPFIFSTKYPATCRRRTPFIIGGSRGLKDFYGGLCNVFGQWIELDPGIIRFIEFDTMHPDRYNDGQFDIMTLPLNHIKSSVGFRIETDDGLIIVYTGDTDVCDNVVALAKNADILICESALPDELKVDGHLTPSHAGNVASAAQVKHLVLTHFYPECDFVDMEAQCRKTYTGPLVLARDLMQIELNRAGVRVKSQGL